MVLPGGVDGDAGRREFDARLRAVGAVEAAAVDAERQPDAALLLGGREFGAALLRFKVFRPDEVEQLAQHQHVGLLPGRRRRGLVVEVLVAELQRVLAHLLRQHVHGDFRGQERLRRSVGAERRSPRMVGGDRAAVTADVVEMIAGADELSLPDRQEIAELGIRTVIDPPVGLHRGQLAGRVAGQLDVDVSGGAFAGIDDVLVLAVDERHRPAGGQHGDAEQRLHRRARTCSRTFRPPVLDQPQLLRLDADARADHRVMQVHADALGLDRQHAVVVNSRPRRSRARGADAAAGCNRS